MCNSHLCSTPFNTGNILSKMSQSSPNGAAAVADPYQIYSTAGASISSGREINEEVEGDRSRTNRVHSDRNVGLNEFVDDLDVDRGLTMGGYRSTWSGGSYNIGGDNSTFSRSDTKPVESTRSNLSYNDHQHRDEDQSSPIEESYLQGFDDISFGDDDPPASQGEREPVSETTIVGASVSPATQEQERLDLKRSRSLEKGNRSGGVTVGIPYSHEDEGSWTGFGEVRGNGQGSEKANSLGHREWGIPRKLQNTFQNLLDYDYPGNWVIV